MKISAKTTPSVLAISVAVTLFCARIGSAAEKYPACAAATAAVNYGNALAISAETRARIESYRSGWKALCDPKGHEKPSLADLYGMAKQIEADFKKAFDAFDEALLSETSFNPRRSDAVNDLVAKQLPGFVPAFKGAFGDHEYFSPSADAFRQSDPLGTSEDRLFFESRFPLEGDFPPFISKTWDYGGCDKFGEFDWTGALKAIARVKKQVKSPAYLQETSLFEDNLVHELSPGFDICTCKGTAAVMKDLLEAHKYIQKEPGFSSDAPRIQQSIDAIQSGKIKIRSEAEKHCSGG
jgi:hypothetical protein